jgi:triphosphoribosyl-dephospho-CoA synthetase
MELYLTLLVDLREQTLNLESIIASHDIERALELIDSRLLLLDKLHSLGQQNEQARSQIRIVAQEILPREQLMIAKLNDEKSAVSALLVQALSGNKANLLYQRFSQE